LGCRGGLWHLTADFSKGLHRQWPSFTGCTQTASRSPLRGVGLRVQSRIIATLGRWKQPKVIKAPADVCPLCEGTGWKTAPLRPDSVRNTTERRVIRCDCQLRTRSESLLAAAHIPKRYEHCELASYTTDFPGADKSLAEAYFIASRFVKEYDPRGDRGLLIVGEIGTGKTHLAVGVLKELVNRGIACLFYDYRELLKEIQNSYNSTVKATELDVLRPVFEADVLVLDELGAVKPTDWVWDTVSLILNTRYNDKRTTIITTNFPDLKARERPANAGSRSPEEARYAAEKETLGDRITDRMYSRLHEMCRAITLSGADFRQKVLRAGLR
jgi:DNA replication protein DnaC